MSGMVDEQGTCVLLEYTTARGCLSVLKLMFPICSEPVKMSLANNNESSSIPLSQSLANHRYASNNPISKLTEPLLSDALIQSSLLNHPSLVVHLLNVIQRMPEESRPHRALSTALILASKHNRVETLHVLLNGMDNDTGFEMYQEKNKDQHISNIVVDSNYGNSKHMHDKQLQIQQLSLSDSVSPYLVCNKVKVNPNTQDGSSLVWAARMGHVETIRLLLAHGADASLQGGLAVLREAEYGHVDVLRLLLSSSAEM